MSNLTNNYITASQETISDNDIVKETYKRIYHNLPYLLKTRGTKTGLRALINCFGIPETILRVNEFAGQDRQNYELDLQKLQLRARKCYKIYICGNNAAWDRDRSIVPAARPGLGT